MQLIRESTPKKPRKCPPPSPNVDQLQKREQLKETFYDVSRLSLPKCEITWVMSGRNLNDGEQTLWSEMRPPVPRSAQAIKRFAAIQGIGR